MSDQKQKVNYEEIAKTANVSIATVSRVLNQRNLVKPQTLKRVLTAMQSLGYKADLAAPYVSNFSKIILVILPNISHIYYIDIVKGIKSAASAHDYTVLISDGIINDVSFEPLLYLIKKNLISGIINCGDNIPPSIYRQIRGLIPIVQCCDRSMEPDISYVACDDMKAMSRLMQYVFALGCKKVAFINGDPRRFTYAHIRLEAYAAAMKKAGNDIRPNWVIPLSEVNHKSATSAAMSILQSDDIPECIVCSSDLIAVAVLRSCQELNLRVPKDIMVTGYDNIEIAKTSSPALTTVNQPRNEIGLTACSYLLEQIANPAAPIMHTLLETELVIRESTIGF